MKLESELPWYLHRCWRTCYCRCPYNEQQLLWRSKKTTDELVEIDDLRLGNKISDEGDGVYQGSVDWRKAERKSGLERNWSSERQPHSACNRSINTLHRDMLENDFHRSAEGRQCFIAMELLRSCRQIYCEATEVLWSTNTFSFRSCYDLKMFMDDRTSIQKTRIKSLRLDMDFHNGPPDAWNAGVPMPIIRSLVGLRNLHIFIGASRPISPRSAALTNLYASYIRLCLSEVAKFRILPIQSATVVITRPTHPHITDWPHEERVKTAEALRQKILDPKGPEKYEEEQLFLNKLKQDKELLDARWALEQRTCQNASTTEECAQQRQKAQDDDDGRTGRKRRKLKPAGPCRHGHACLICLQDKGLGIVDSYECRIPGRCNQSLSPEEVASEQRE